MNGERSMSAGHSRAWASPRLSGSQCDGNSNQEPLPIITPGLTKTQKHRKGRIKRIRHPTDTYLLLKFIQLLTIFILNVVLFCLCVVFCFSILPIVLLVQKIARSCCVRYNSRYGKLRQVSRQDAVWLLPNSRINTGSMSSIFFLMEGKISQDEVTEFMQENWLYYCGNRKKYRFPKLREFAVRICTGFAWKQINDFLTESHISSSTDTNKLFQCNEDRIENTYYSGPHDTERENHQLSWKVTLFPKYLDSEDTGLLIQMHPSLADIFPFSRLTLESLGYKTVYLRDRCYPVQQSCLYLCTAFAGPLMVLSRILLPRPNCGLDRCPCIPAALLRGDETVMWSDAIDFKFVRKIKDITRTKVHVVLMSCLSGALRSFLSKCGEEYPRDVRACVQADIRPQHAKLELDNKLSVMFVDLPSGTEGAVPRLWAMRRRMETFSGIIERYALYSFLKLCLLLFPLSLARRLVDYIYSKSSCTVTYFPGPNTPVYLNGKMAKLMTFWTPRSTEKGISLSMVTHANQVRLGVVVHQQLPCDPKIILTEFKREVEDLYKHLSHRTLPSHLRLRARQQLKIDGQDGKNAIEEQV